MTLNAGNLESLLATSLKIKVTSFTSAYSRGICQNFVCIAQIKKRGCEKYRDVYGRQQRDFKRGRGGFRDHRREIRNDAGEQDDSS